MGGFGLPFLLVLVMKNDPSLNYVVAGVCRSALAVSALILSAAAFAADPPVPRGNVSVNVNPTTGYYSTSNTTLRLPNGVRATTSSGLPVVTSYPAGLQQTIPTGITIDAIKKTAPLSATVRATIPRLKQGAKTLFKGGLQGIVLTAGLQKMLDAVDWLIEDGQTVRFTARELETIPAGVSTRGVTAYASDIYVYDARNALGRYEKRYCPRKFYESQMVFIGYRRTGSCYYALPDEYPSGLITSPVSDTDIDDAVDSRYVPEPADWTNLTPHMMPDDVEITWAPTLQGEPKTTTVYDADGNPVKVQETNIWYDFDIRDNPSPAPALDLKTREETKTYEDGVLTNTTTTNSTESAGSEDTPPPPPENPIDCDLFPTACAWMEWTKEEPVQPDDDLSKLLKEVPVVNETYTITGGAAACPAPLVLDLSMFGSREVSYQPLCDLASTMKYLYLALMSFAAAVLLNRSINRV